MKTIVNPRRYHYIAKVNILLVTVALIAGMAGCVPASQNLEIRTWYDLDAARDNLAGHHTLMNDLDSTTSGYEELAGQTANGGKGWSPIGTGIGELAFGGFFSGQGYEIRDLFINRPNENYVGLFGVLSGGEIRDIGLVNVTVTGNECVGALVGRNDYASLRNCHFAGRVNGEGLSVGGLVGYNFFGMVGDSSSTGNVTGYRNVGGLVGCNYEGSVYGSYSTCSVSGDKYVGGLVGRNHQGEVAVSYATGNVTGNGIVGGLVGDNNQPPGAGGGVTKCYSAGSVVSSGFAGGLIGANFAGGWVLDCFWDTETSGQPTSDGGTGKNTTEMQDIITFSDAGWNITAVALNETNPGYIWNIVNNATYPFLGWQTLS